jgi:hypothetical protein
MATLRYNSVNSVIIEAAMQVLIIILFTLLYLSVRILLLCRKYLHGVSIITLLTLLYLSVGILLLCRKDLHGRFYNAAIQVLST